MLVPHLYTRDANGLHSLTNSAATMEELQDVIAEDWAPISAKSLRKLAHSMPKRLQAVIDAKGDCTKTVTTVVTL